MTDFDLLRAYRSLMSQLSLLGDGATMKFDKDSVKGGEKSSTPSGVWAKFDELPLCSQLALQWPKAESKDAQWQLIRDYEHARDEFKSSRRPERIVVESDQARAKRIVLKGEGWTVHEVVLGLDMVDLTAQEVRRARSEADRDLLRGFPLPKAVDVRERVLQLHAAKLSYQEIENMTGIKKWTARRWVCGDEREAA